MMLSVQKPQSKLTVIKTRIQLFVGKFLNRKKSTNTITKDAKKQIKHCNIILKCFVGSEATHLCPYSDWNIEETTLDTFAFKDFSLSIPTKCCNPSNAPISVNSTGIHKKYCSSEGYFTPTGTWSPISYRKHHTDKRNLIEEECGGNKTGLPQGLSISKTLDEGSYISKSELELKLKRGEDLYPNSDISIWLRSCQKEVIHPLDGNIIGKASSGVIPNWIKGTLLRNGPGSLQVGEMSFKHLFDASALLHRFSIDGGKVAYQCRFLQCETYKRNTRAQRIVVTEFGTESVPDPCQTIYQSVSALFNPGELLSDNAMISVYPFGDQFYTFTESPIIHRIDPVTLETKERVNVSKYIGIVHHTSHPHVLSDGTVYNLGLSIFPSGPFYTIMKFPATQKGSASRDGTTGSMFESAELVASAKARWPMHPSYMHTFGITDHYFVIVEQPLSIAVGTMLKCHLTKQPLRPGLKWYSDKETLIHILARSSGLIVATFVAEAFFYLHIINQYEDANHVIVDICCYSDPYMLDCMFVEAMKNANKNPDYARMFRGRPMRFVLPLDVPLTNGNLIKLTGTKATAYMKDDKVFVRPELLCGTGCETPRINYTCNLGKPYRYFYAISSDVDMHNPGTLIKMDLANRTTNTWCEEGVYPSEPIFVPTKAQNAEDDGVILSALVWGKDRPNQVGLLVLDATTWKEIGRAVFNAPGPVPKCLHGWFVPGTV